MKLFLQEMGCSPSKSNTVHPILNLSSAKANGSLPGKLIRYTNGFNIFSTENSSATVNGTSNDQHFTTETTKELDELSPNQSNCNKEQNSDQSSNKLKELVSVHIQYFF